MDTSANPQIELAYNYVCLTNKHIFLTGKAGTGKTTFLHRIREETHKRLAVVAPTGVAAINAQGVTIHSLFQLPFGTLIPGQTGKGIKRQRFSGKKIKLLKSLDLLIIDEISMVRADVLDAIDDVLRRYRDYTKPFGGIQLLMIGDLHQLPPVVKPEDWELLRPYYETTYFFGSLALQKTDAVTIELKHIYRQSDNYFINLLNKVRNNHMDAEVLEALNSRYRSDFKPKDKEGYITLTSHNVTAREINTDKLKEIPGQTYRFNASVEGDFPKHAYPNEMELEFKVDAQVMFVKNDLSQEKLYYNGKIGRIAEIDKDKIYVACPGEEENIMVIPVGWENMKFTLNEKTKEVEEEVLGTFRQYPLKLAWAITIHKSQGLTFERVIIDAKAAFAHGQVYVALSRCKSFEGIVLRSQIIPTSVRTDHEVRNFTEETQKRQPGEAQLQNAKKEYQQELLRDLFSFKVLKNKLEQLMRAILENENSLEGNSKADLDALTDKAKNSVIIFADKFKPHLEGYLRQPSLPEENEKLNERLQKASAYFSKQLEEELIVLAKEMQIVTDNKAVRKKVQEKLEDLRKELFIKNACFQACSKSFVATAYIKAKIDADLDYKKPQIKSTTPHISPKDIAHPELYERLSQWRAEIAEEREVERYQILPTRTLLEIAEVRPTSLTNLKRIKGIGKARANQFGGPLLEIVLQYSADHQLETDQLQFATGKAPKEPKPPKPDTKAISMEMFQSGKSIEEIAEERGFVTSTIEGHLSHYIGTGELDVYTFVEKKKVDAIVAYFEKAEHHGFTEALNALGSGYTYGSLRMVLAYMERS